VEETENLEI